MTLALNLHVREIEEKKLFGLANATAEVKQGKIAAKFVFLAESLKHSNLVFREIFGKFPGNPNILVVHLIVVFNDQISWLPVTSITYTKSVRSTRNHLVFYPCQ